MNNLTTEIESLNQWKGHEERVEEILSPLKVEGYHAVLDTGEPSANEGEPAPPGIHWMLARSNTPHSQLGHDGHGRRGGFIPPINLPRKGGLIVSVSPFPTRCVRLDRSLGTCAPPDISRP